MFSRLTQLETTIYEEIVEKNNTKSINFQLMVDKGCHVKGLDFKCLQVDQ